MALKLDYNVELQYELKTVTDTLVDVEKTKTEYTQVKDCYVKIVDIIPAYTVCSPYQSYGNYGGCNGCC